MQFPTTRMRRLRENPVLRDLVRETKLTVDDLVMPLFVVEGISEREEIKSMPGQYRWPLNELGSVCRDIAGRGVKSIILFGIPADKDAVGSQAYAADGIVQEAVRAAKAAVPELLVITDVCLCEYTDHGHCGVIEDGRMLNDPTLDLLSQTALSHADAGADIVAPSDMTDGRVQAIRETLDGAGYERLPIISYAVKYASAYYGPFRDAADSTPQFGDRRSYQMDPGNGREALREAELDIVEGADILMVKPALAYLDIIRRVRDFCDLPLAAYNVSGEYAMVKAAAANGWVDEQRIVLETLTAIKRSGADIILTYHALDAAGWLAE